MKKIKQYIIPTIIMIMIGIFINTSTHFIVKIHDTLVYEAIAESISETDQTIPAEPIIHEGKYTICTGWTKPIYIEAYYIDDNQVLYYKEQGFDDFVPIPLSNTIFAHGYLMGEELTGYGYYYDYDILDEQ